MLETTAMSRLVVAGDKARLSEALRVAADLGHVHLEAFTDVDDVFHIGTPDGGADDASARLTQVRSVVSDPDVPTLNSDGPVRLKEVQDALQGGFWAELERILEMIDARRSSVAELNRLEELALVMERIAPLDIPLELYTGYEHLEVMVATTSRAKRIVDEIAPHKSEVDYLVKGSVVIVAAPKRLVPEVQMAISSIGGTPILIPNLSSSESTFTPVIDRSGSPAEIAGQARSEIAKIEAKNEQRGEDIRSWGLEHGRMTLSVLEHLEREVAVLTGHVQCATSANAFVLSGWIPTSTESPTRDAFVDLASHIEIEPYVASHGHHHGDEDHHHDAPLPPVAFKNQGGAETFEVITALGGYPRYGSLDPTRILMYTFPIIYGMILGDAAYGLVLYGLSVLISRMPALQNPVGQAGAGVLKWMGISTIIWGILYTEFLGFTLVGPYDTYLIQASGANGTFTGEANLFAIFGSIAANEPEFIVSFPFHRVSYHLEYYITLSVMVGVIHLLVGYILGFINVLKAHGMAAAIFEKGGWIIILIGGVGHVTGYLWGNWDPVAPTAFIGIVAVGVLILIVGLAVYEGMGWLGGIIMGPIESLSLLGNILSYLRIMAVGVAGVKIAELGNDQGFLPMIEAIQAVPENPLNLLLVVAFLLIWLGVQALAIALALISPSVHAVRLHLVEWMGKFYDGSGDPFEPLGGTPYHVDRST